MNIRSDGATHTGKVRLKNEDTFFISDKHHAYAVADGIGGLPGGARASQRIVSILESAYDFEARNTAYYDLTELILRMNEIITDEICIDHPETGAGSTITLCQIKRDELHIAHVGDSAAYLLHQGHIEKITLDHTMEQEMVDTFGAGARSSMPPDYSHTLTRCIGQPENLVVDHTRAHLSPGDRILLCTDGLNKVIGDAAIETLLSAGDSPEVICQSLIDAANAKCGPDNITAIVIIIDDN